MARPLPSWAWGREGGRGGQPRPWMLFVTWSHHSEARTMVQATPRPEEGREGEIDYPINQLLGTDYKINHQGKGQALYYITQPTRFIDRLGHHSLLPSITGSRSSPFTASGMALPADTTRHSPAGSSTRL